MGAFAHRTRHSIPGPIGLWPSDDAKYIYFSFKRCHSYPYQYCSKTLMKLNTAQRLLMKLKTVSSPWSPEKPSCIFPVFRGIEQDLPCEKKRMEAEKAKAGSRQDWTLLMQTLNLATLYLASVAAASVLFIVDSLPQSLLHIACRVSISWNSSVLCLQLSWVGLWWYGPASWYYHLRFTHTPSCDSISGLS